MTTQFSNTKFLPLTYVVKYDPPMIGMVYKLSEKDTKKRIYKIYLHGLIYKNDAEQITRQLFQEHALHINENVVSHKQIKNLVNKILQHRAKKSEGSSPGEKKPSAGVNALRSDFLSMEEGKKGQDFGKNKPGFQHQGNKYAYQDEEDENEYDQRGDHDNLEFDGEIEDLEGDNVFDYGNYGSGSQQRGADKKLGGGQAGFIKGFADKKAQEKANDEMDFILDDPDNLDNFSDY